MTIKDSWDKYKEEFKSRKETIDDIKTFLDNTYSIELLSMKFKTEIKPRSRWKHELNKELSGLDNIVYIWSYINENSESKPLICGITKTGPKKTSDFNINLKENEHLKSNNISGRKFLVDETIDVGKPFDYDKRIIHYFSCESKLEAQLLERAIQYRFNLFGS